MGWQEQDVKLAAAHELQEEKRSKGRQLDGRGRVLLRETLELTGAKSSKQYTNIGNNIVIPRWIV